jgi:predicted DNA-binding ribbon-helix-helix protein
MTSLINRNVIVDGHRTSMRLEPEFWGMLHDICERTGVDIHTLVGQIDVAGRAGGRTSAVRVYIATYFRALAMEGCDAKV